MKVVMLHGYSDSNKGDLAIVVASIQAIKNIYPKSEITLQTVFSKEDPEYIEHHRFVSQLGINVEPMMIPSPYVDNGSHGVFRNLKAMLNLSSNYIKQFIYLKSERVSKFLGIECSALESIKSADIVLLKGGQYIYNDQGGIRGYLYLWRILNPIYIAAHYNKKVVMLGQSIGPVATRLAKKMTKHALGKCKKLVVREDLSYDLMKELSLDRISVIAPDMAFLTTPKNTQALQNTSSIFDGAKWLGVTVVNWSYPGAPDLHLARKNYEDAIFEASLHMSKKGYRIALFPQVTVKHHGESDMDVIERLADRLKLADISSVIISNDMWPDEFSYLYSRCEMLLGTRLHSCILAACAYTPVVAIRYQGFKTQGVMKSLGIGQFVHDINNVTSEELISSLESVEVKNAEIRALLSDRVSNFKAELMNIIQNINE